MAQRQDIGYNIFRGTITGVASLKLFSMAGFKYLLAVFALPLFLLTMSGPAQADMNQTFDMKGLSEGYALPCDKQASLRVSYIPPAYFPGRPSEFTNDSRALVVYSPHLTKSQRKTAERLMASVPAHVLPIAYLRGAVYVFTRRSIVEAVPALAVEDSWFGDFGLYMAVERRLYFSFEKGEGITAQPDGTYKARRFVPSQREPFRIINHETGHLVDSLVGEYSLQSKGDDGDSRLSNRKDFLAALKSDLARLVSENNPLSKAEIARLGYYMPREFEDTALGGLHPTEQRARREIFAELWAEAQGYDSNKISRAYPDTFKVVKTINQFLKTQYEKTPAHCE